MSATTHHTTLPAEASAKAGHYHPETVADLEAVIAAKIMRGKDLSEQLFNIHRSRLAGRPTHPPAWLIRAQIEILNDELALDFAELDRRRI